MSESHVPAGHAFISYVREDSRHVDLLQDRLEAAGVPVWRDTTDLWPGEDWRAKIRQAITDNALVFIACFSQASLARKRTYQNEELTLAIEQLRQRRPDDPWLIPVRLDECEIPDWDIGGGRTLTSIQRVDLFGNHSREGMARLVEAVKRILGNRTETPLIAIDNIPVKTMVALPGRRLATGGDDGRILIWDLAAPDHQPLELGHHKGKVCALEVLADGQIISGHDDGWVLLWHPDLPRHSTVVRPGPAPDIGAPYPRSAGSGVQAMAALKDGRVAVVKVDGEVDLWNPQAQFGSLSTWAGLEDNPQVLAVARLSDGLVTGGMDGRVLVWDLAAPPPPSLPPVRATPRPPHLRLCGPQEGPPQADRKRYSEVGHREDRVRTVAALPDGRVITGGDDGQVLLWNPATRGNRPAALGHHDGWVFAVTTLPDGRVASGGKDGRLLLWDPANGSIEFAQLGGWVIALAVVPLDRTEVHLVVAQQGHGFSVWPVTTSDSR